MQKFLYELNREERAQCAYREDPDAAMDGYDLDGHEREALREPDIGLLYHLGVNGQILMHFAAFRGIAWDDYLQRMRDGLRLHGPVRDGVYALAGYEGVDAHARRLGHEASADTSARTADGIDPADGHGGRRQAETPCSAADPSTETASTGAAR